jgi:hypothetical protein
MIKLNILSVTSLIYNIPKNQQFCSKLNRMQTIRLRISDKVFDNLRWFLSRFSTDEIQVLKENDQYLSIRNYLHGELSQLEEGKAEYHTLEELENQLDATIRKYED